jgi:CBS-domain-containing membrane protein
MNTVDGRTGGQFEEDPNRRHRPASWAPTPSRADRTDHVRLGVLPVVDRADSTKFVGLVTQFDLLDARQKFLEEERKAERVLLVRRPSVQTVAESSAEQPD